MEILYRREMKHNYLVVEPEQASVFGYEAGMMVSNRIEGLLRFHIKYMDERRFYYYEITSLQPLSRLLEGRFIRKEEIRGLLLGLHGLLLRLEEYFLCADGLLMGPEYIYVDPEWARIEFCLVPGRENDFSGELSRLLQYILKKVDHRDKEAVVLSYGLYQESLKENYGIEDLMRLVGRSGGTEGAEKEKEEGYRERPGPELEERQRYETSREDKEPSPYGEAAAGNTGKRGFFMSLGLQIGALLVLGGAGLGIVWLFRGSAAVGRILGVWGAGLAALAVLAAAGNVIFYVLGRRRAGAEAPQEPEQRRPEGGAVEEGYREEERRAGPSEGRRQRQERGWEIREIEETYGETGREAFEQRAKGSQPEEEGREPACQTVLLAKGHGEETLHRLEALDGLGEDIMIPYFPFIIGKQEELADYILSQDTVSRLHLRLDREGESFSVTDLNSTNGTYVAGRLLEANETAELRVGDAVGIAQLRFVFR